MDKEHIEKLTTFLEKNTLNFNEGSNRGAATVIAGYADYLGVTDIELVVKAVEDFEANKGKQIDLFGSKGADNFNFDVENDLKIACNYAFTHDYGKAWKNGEYKSQYIY